jgi:hypothetical protein
MMFYITVRSGSHVQTHKVEGAGSNKLQAFNHAVKEIATAFPSDGGHEIIGVKSKDGVSIQL